MIEVTELKKCCHKILNLVQSREQEAAPTQALDIEAFLNDLPEDHKIRLREEFLGFGPLTPLLEKPHLTEIIINGPEQIWFEAQGQLIRHDDTFLSELTFTNCLHRMGAEMGSSPDLNIPFADGMWKNFRAHFLQPPLTPQPQITLRKLPQKSWTFQQLSQKAWAHPNSIKELRNWIQQQMNFLIVGPTGSGKTSVLNACLQEMDPSERVLCLEDISELKPQPGASCKLLTRQDRHGLLKDFTLADLVRQSLRMRPSRLVLGEVRGPEAKDLLLALATGHKGSLGTLHACHPRQALLRLEMLVQLGAGQWDQQTIRQLIHLSLDGLVMVDQQNGVRRLEGLYKIASLETVGLLLEKVG